MPIYESPEYPLEKLKRMARNSVCAECGGPLVVAYDLKDKKDCLACKDWRRTGHEGTTREYQTPFGETPAGQTLGNVPRWRREQMVQELGTERSTALAQYAGSLTLTEEKAALVVKTLWPKAPEAERLAAAIVCHQYGLNPLMKHLFLIKYGDTWDMRIAITANRLIAVREGKFSYEEDTPRAATKQEIDRKYGEEDGAKIAKSNHVSITKLKDMASGATATGFGVFPRDKQPKGTENGNTAQNQADIRGERQALARLRPGALPAGEVVDERFVEGEYTEVKDVGTVDRATGEVVEPEPLAEFDGETSGDVEPKPPEPQKAGPKDRKAIFDALKAKGYTQERMGEVLHRYLKETFGVDGTTDLTQEQAAQVLSWVQSDDVPQVEAATEKLPL